MSLWFYAPRYYERLFFYEQRPNLQERRHLYCLIETAREAECENDGGATLVEMIFEVAMDEKGRKNDKRERGGNGNT